MMKASAYKIKSRILANPRAPQQLRIQMLMAYAVSKGFHLAGTWVGLRKT